MSKLQDRTVSRRPDGDWDNKRNDATKASSVHSTQKAAQDAGRENRLRHGSTAGTPFARASRIDGWLQSASSEALRRLPNEICCLRVAACTALT